MTQSGRPVAVLVVDDEEDQRQLLVLQLQRLGCTVVATRSSEDALSVLDGLELDLAVIDLLLPGMTGWNLVTELTSRRPELPIAVTSILDAESYPPNCRALPKPFKLAQLQAVLEELVPLWSPEPPR